MTRPTETATSPAIAGAAEAREMNVLAAAVVGMGWGVGGAYVLGLAAAALLGTISIVVGFKSVEGTLPLVLIVPILMILPASGAGASVGAVAGAALCYVLDTTRRICLGFLAGAAMPWLCATPFLTLLSMRSPVLWILIAASFYCAGIGALVGRFGRYELGCE